MAATWSVLLFLACWHGVGAENNPFGIGLVSSGSNIDYINLANGVAGDGGHVLLVFAGLSLGSPGTQQDWVDGLSNALDKNMTPVVRLGPPWGQRNIRQDSDDPSHLVYTKLAKVYVSVLSDLLNVAKEHGASSLRVQLLNEVNLCSEWWCSGGGSLNSSQAAREYVGLLSSILDASKALGLQESGLHLAAAPLAPGGTVSCQCCGSGSCQFQPGETGLDYMRHMLVANESIYKHMDFLSSHSYPATSIGSGFFYPFPESTPGLFYYQNETAYLGQPDMPVYITETGWSVQRPQDGSPKPTPPEMAKYTVQAFSQVWLPDPNVRGVMPFVLEDKNWGDDQGFGWVLTNGAVQPVYSAVAKLRCSAGFGPC